MLGDPRLGRLFAIDDDGSVVGYLVLTFGFSLEFGGRNAVVDELFEKLQENRVYFVSKARVNLAKKKFSTVPNDYELSLDRGTDIEEVKFSLHSHR